MPGIADVILSNTGSVEDGLDLDLEDADLARELEELRAKRGQGAIAVAPSDLNAKSDIAQEEATRAGEPSSVAHKQSGHSGRTKASLADEILNGSSGNDEFEFEFEAMEKQLEQQIREYKEQRDSPKASAQAVVQPKHAPILTMEPTAEAPEPTAAEDSPELAALRSQAAQMEEVFPEIPQTATKPVERQRRQVQARAAEREKNRSQAPVDPEILGLRNALEGLDVRLRAVQKQHESHDPLNRQPPVNLESASARVVAELQAQNAHLRERLKVNGKKSLLQLDRSLFAGEAPPSKSTPAAPVMGLQELTAA